METQITSRKKPLTRFGEFELLKAIAILGLPAVHIMEEAIEAGYAGAGLTQFGQAIIGLCAFGPSVFMICMGFGIGGCAHIDPFYVKFFRDFGIEILNGYGTTECSPCVAINRNYYKRDGSVGQIIESMDVRISSDG